MFNNSLQKRLYEMETQNPSENEHMVSLSKRLSDNIHFSLQYVCESVVEYTDPMRENEKQEREKPSRDYALLCTQAALCN